MNAGRRDPQPAYLASMLSAVAEAGATMRWCPSKAGGVPEVSPARLEPADHLTIRTHLQEHGFACVRSGLSKPELQTAEDLLWEHLVRTHGSCTLYPCACVLQLS